MLIIFMNLVLVSGFVLAAQPVFNIGIDGEINTIELISVESDSIILKVTNSSGHSEIREISEQTTQPYTLFNFPNTNLNLIVTDARVQNLDFNATIRVGFEINFSVEGDPQGNLIKDFSKKNISIEGFENQVEFVNADDFSAFIKITNSEGFSETKNIDELIREMRNGPYYEGIELNDFFVIVKEADVRNLELSASILVFYEKNFFVGSCDNECTINEKVCEGNSYKTCGDYDEDICWEWDSVTNCDSGETCENGVCVVDDVPVTCSDECFEGSKECSNDTSYRTCGSYDGDSCLEWSEPTLCPMGPIGIICEGDGECIDSFPDPVPTPEPTHECETIGLRENEKYCSPEYQWESQKLDSNSCENDFECKDNNCKNSVCGEVKIPIKDNKWVIWFIIGGLVLIIFLVVFLIIKR